jgi:hypothetical protein
LETVDRHVGWRREKEREREKCGWDVLVPELAFGRINSAFGRVDEITDEIEIDRIAEV